MRIDLRCPSKLHGVIIDENRFEVKCNSKFCGAGNGVVVLHVFDTTTGKVVETKRFKNPMKERNG